MKISIINTSVDKEVYKYKNLFQYNSPDNMQGYGINVSSGEIGVSADKGVSHKIYVDYKKDTNLSYSMLTSPDVESSRALVSNPDFFIAKYGLGDKFLGISTPNATLTEDVYYVRLQWWGGYGTNVHWAVKLNYGTSFEEEE